MLHSLNVQSLLPETIYLPFGENITELIESLWPISVITSFCDLMFHSLIYLSSPAEIK
jgi:hypothetical protein